VTDIAYPFVVARNRTLDWRALVAPDELISANEDYALVLQTGEEHPAPVTIRRWDDHSARPWVLCYRSVPADPGFVGEDRSGQLKDKFGRKLYLVEGVVLPGSGEPSTARARELVEQVHDDAVSAFRDFWSEVDEAVAPIASAPIRAGSVATAPLPTAPSSTRPHQGDDRADGIEPAPWWRSMLRERGLVLAGGAIAVVLALAWLAVRALGGGAGG
jgi:hypothetical protein